MKRRALLRHLRKHLVKSCLPAAAPREGMPPNAVNGFVFMLPFGFGKSGVFVPA
jgi:hypothetical protein